MKAAKLATLKKALLNQKVITNVVHDKKGIKTNEYHLTYRERGKTLEIHDFVSNGGLTYKKAIAFKKKLIKHAKDNNMNKIVANTWIFYEYPKYAELFGFKLVEGSARDYERLKKKYNVKKIIGADVNKYRLYAFDNTGNICVMKFNFKHTLPRWELDLNG